MALSMGEERILAEIENHLVQEDPTLAQRLESFGHRSLHRAVDRGKGARPRRWGIIGTVVLLAALFVTMIVAVVRGPGKPDEHQQPYRPPAGPAVIVPPAGEMTATSPAMDHAG